MVKYATAGSMTAEELHAGFLLFGDPGAGKTHAACLAPRPFVVLTEQNGLTTIRRANPDAIVAVVHNTADLREALGLAVRAELPEGCQTLVVDSLTEVQRLFQDEIMATKRGGEPFSLQDWGTLTDKMRRFMRTLRDLPYSVVCTALAEAQVSEADGVRYVRPAFQGKKTSMEVAQYFNGVAYLFKRAVQGEGGEDAIQHFAMLDGPSNYITKPCHPVTGVVEPRVDNWFAALAGDNTDASAS
jgi:CheY-like chemotaxis protein